MVAIRHWPVWRRWGVMRHFPVVTHIPVLFSVIQVLVLEAIVLIEDVDVQGIQLSLVDVRVVASQSVVV